MLSKEQIFYSVSSANIPMEVGIEIIRSYIFLRKEETIDIIPPKDQRESDLMKYFLVYIRNWAA